MSYERRILIRHSIASIIALALFGISRFLYSIIISRKFGVEVLGSANSLISQAFLIAMPLGFFAVALGKYSSEFLAREDFEKIKSMVSVSFSFPLIGILLAPLNVYLAVLSVLRAIQLTFRSFIYGIHKGEVYSYAMIIGFIPLFLSFYLDDPFLPYISLLSTIAFFSFGYLIKNDLFGKPRREEFYLLLRYSSFAFLGTLSGVFLVQGPYFLSEKLGSALIAGRVSASLSAAFLLTYLPQVLQSAIMPIYSYKYGRADLNYVKLLAEKTTELLSLFTAFVVFILLLIGKEVISFLFGFNLGEEFYIALIAVEIYIAYNPSIVALNSTKYVKEGSLISILGALIALIAWIPSIKKFSEYGTMVGLLIGYMAILVGTAYTSHKKLKISPKSYKPLLFAIPLQLLVFISKTMLFAGILLYGLAMKEEITESIKAFHGKGF
ncbi:MAG TPA: lipopolysaccharide biosynthesis protein [Thermococcus paralvinellae]|uniref:Lipopolysaccharide biosynthesis protein n=1 Tax=Thermococcus paralvinellae TaxID=582419 RepID=A0A832ZH98_9EURY|nr:lipopolysaccharide biosynthesis protein [Thermococcus paralvinellae]HIP88911.1 lipopolysaccharide biosynthesis protein [Thermococcus paralvinellae]